MSTLAWIAFALSMVVNLRGLFDAVVSIRHPERRRWPPPESAHRSPALVRVHSAVTALGVPVIGLLDWNQFVFDSPWRFAIAGALFGAAVFASRAHRTLGTEESVGQAPPGGELTLRTDGPYGVVRHPQYAGALPGYLAVAFATNSLLAILATLVMCTTLFAMVFAEEAWLRDRFGEPYEAYCRQVPRFLPNALNPFRSR